MWCGSTDLCRSCAAVWWWPSRLLVRTALHGSCKNCRRKVQYFTESIFKPLPPLSRRRGNNLAETIKSSQVSRLASDPTIIICTNTRGHGQLRTQANISAGLDCDGVAGLIKGRPTQEQSQNLLPSSLRNRHVDYAALHATNQPPVTTTTRRRTITGSRIAIPHTADNAFLWA